MSIRMILIFLLSVLLVEGLGENLYCYAEEPTAAATNGTPASTGSASGPQKIDVNSLKKRYWENNSPELNVVQNRVYTKSGRLNLQAFGGWVSHDPFLNTSNVGVSIGMNINEYFGLHAIYWRFFESNSPAVAALQNAESQSGSSLYAPNLNPLQYLAGGEVSWSLLYGKLSLLGQAILHFDFFILGGAGGLFAQNGTSIAPWLGVGQQFYITQFLALRFDFRYLLYQETLIEDNSVSTKGNVLGTRVTTAPLVNLGLSLYLF